MAKSNNRRDQQRREAAAARVAEMQRQQAVAARKQRLLIISVSVVVVIAVVVGITIIVATRNAKTVAAQAGGTGATANYGFVVGKASAPVKMVAYEDFQCPHCEELESTMGSLINKNIADGKLSVEYRPVSFLDSSSSTEYSTRALNAAVCVNKYGGSAAFKKMHDLLYANQPAEGTAGLPNSQLITYANQAVGKTLPAVTTCINNETFKSWTVSATNAFSVATAHYPTGESTPTLIMNGQLVSSTTYASATAFQAAINKAAGNAS